MLIDCISDLHGFFPELEGGDLLIIAGDITASDKISEWHEFFQWFGRQKYRKKVLVAGNHDGFLTQCSSSKEARELGLPDELLDTYYEYLCDTGTEFEGFKIYGSPWTPEFYNWHFMKNRGAELREVWDKIPDDIDILITHGPALGILDEVKYSSKRYQNKNAGCEELLKALERIKPKLHVFGHIHECGGRSLLFKHVGPNTLCVNASIMNEDYEPMNKPVRVILEKNAPYVRHSYETNPCLQ